MPQLEKTLRMDRSELEKKINIGIRSQCALTYLRGKWETTIDDVTCVLLVYEQHAEKVYVRPDKPREGLEDWDPDYKPSWFNLYAQEDFQQQPHYSISINLVIHGEEIQLCAITSGSGQEHYFLPDSGAEYGLFEALDITLNNLDSIII